jgi:hypothetical protein
MEEDWARPFARAGDAIREALAARRPLVADRTDRSANGAKKELFYCQNGTGGSGHTASAAFNTNSFGTIYLIELTGVTTTSFDLTTQGTDATSTFGVATGTLSQANEVIITLIGNGDSNNPMNYASSNMTELAEEGDGSNFWTSAIYKQVVAATTSFTPAITSASSGTHATINATFKATGGGGGGVTPRPLLLRGVG